MSSTQERYSSFLGKLDCLPPELIDRILLLSFFSESYGNGFHSVLHVIMLISQLKSFPRLQKNLISFMRTDFLRKEILKRSSFYSDYTSACQARHEISLDDVIPNNLFVFRHCQLRDEDPLLQTIIDCSSCFEFLLFYHTITPSYYNRDGESLLYMALKKRRKRIARILIRTSTLDGLALPLWLTSGKVGPSALDIASSDDFILERGIYGHSIEEVGKPQFDYHSFIYNALKKHPRRKKIGLKYIEQFKRDHPEVIHREIFFETHIRNVTK